LLQELIQQWPLLVRRGRGQVLLVCRSTRGAHALPRDALVTALEGDGEALEVPQERPQSSQEVDAEDEVEAAEGEPHTRDGEGLATDEDGQITGDPLARQTLPVRDSDTEVVAAMRNNPQAAHDRNLEEGVCGAGVQQGEETFPVDGDGQQHGVVGADPCKSVHGDHQSISSSPVWWCRGVLGSGVRGVLRPGEDVVVDVVGGLQVEDTRADVAAHVLLIAVVAKPLATALEHLRRCQATEGAGGCSGASRVRRSRSGRTGWSPSPSG